MPTRTKPLSARRRARAEGTPATPATEDGSGFARLSAGARKLRTGGGSLNLSERTLMIAGGIAAGVGLLLVYLGWYGASHTPNVYEQIPYMISGGLLGLGLVFLGAFFYFSHWVTELVKEHRAQSAALVEAIARLEATVTKEAGNDRLVLARVASTNGRAVDAGADDDDDQWAPTLELVATTKGSMAHRPDCVVVAGKHGLRTVDASDGLVACKLCDPYAAGESASLS